MDEVKITLPVSPSFSLRIPAVSISFPKGAMVLSGDTPCTRFAAILTMRLAAGIVFTVRGCSLLIGVQAISSQILMMSVQVILILRGASSTQGIMNSTYCYQ
jgi:hypothetical protein